MPSRYPVRLTAGTYRDGTVEVFYQGKWGTVCADQWNTPDADVICKQMGFPGSSRAVTRFVCLFVVVVVVVVVYLILHSSSQYVDYSVPVWLGGVSCGGNELHITDCPNDGWGSSSCDYYLQAGVTCEPERYPIRLTGGASDNMGTVEVLRNVCVCLTPILFPC